MTEFIIEDFQITVNLTVYATWQKGLRGYHEKGGQQIDPDEPAGWEVESVRWGKTDITSELSAIELLWIEKWLAENEPGRIDG